MKIKKETGVPTPKQRVRITDTRAQEDALKALKVGDSFFVPGAKANDLDGLRRIGKRIGVHLTVAATAKDPRHRVAGVRAWRIDLQATTLAKIVVDPSESVLEGL